VPLMLVSFISIGIIFTVVHVAREIGENITIISQSSNFASAVGHFATGPMNISKQVSRHARNRMNAIRNRLRKGDN